MDNNDVDDLNVDNDKWWADYAYEINKLDSLSNDGENDGGNYGGNDGEDVDRDDIELFEDSDNMTDDEEYMINRDNAAAIQMISSEEIVYLENEDGVDDGSGVDQSKYFDFDIGGRFKPWNSDDDGADSGSDFVPVSSSDEEDWTREPRSTKQVEEIHFNPKVDIKDFQFCVDMIFEGPAQLKHQIRSYAAKHRYPIWFKKNDKVRVQAKCTNCPWALYASYEGKEQTFKVKSYQKTHRCTSNTRVKAVNSKWLADILGDRIRLTPFMRVIEIKNLVKKEVGVDVNTKLCLRTKKRALAAVRESMNEHYAQLWNYVNELDRSNPGTTIVLKGTGDEWEGPPQFRRFYVCFHAVKKNFVQGCRKFVGVDGCFLKTWIKGELLTAMGRDANNQMFPIAWAVVEKEDQHTWGWFLNLVARDIGIGYGDGWTLMSDQQKGLELAVKNLFPEIQHRNCARHIYANFRKRGFTGVNYRKFFWAAAKSTTEDEFKKNMEKIKSLSELAYKHLMDRDPSRWSKAFFSTDCTVDSVDNNMCESFNCWILEARYELYFFSPNVQAALQPSFSRRGRTFITGHALQNQSKSQQKKPRH